MNAINSILLEGDVIEAAKELPNSDRRVVFRIQSDRTVEYEKEGNVTYVDESTVTDIIVEGKLADICRKCCNEGRGVRVLGRLMTGGTIFAEHVEVKPRYKQSPLDEDDAEDEL